MTVSVRSADSHDVSAIQALEEQTPAAAHWTAEQYQKLVTTGVILVAEEAAVMSAERTGTISGFLCARDVAREWEIENVAVAASILRQGVGSGLLRALIERAKSEGAKAILLEVRESNLAARRLYEKHGFQETGRRRNYYNHPPEDAVLYTLGVA
jgi:[ribosomal protein S18]-alanine N-acetyltransferase